MQFLNGWRKTDPSRRPNEPTMTIAEFQPTVPQNIVMSLKCHQLSRKMAGNVLLLVAPILSVAGKCYGQYISWQWRHLLLFSMVTIADAMLQGNKS